MGKPHFPLGLAQVSTARCSNPGKEGRTVKIFYRAGVFVEKERTFSGRRERPMPNPARTGVGSTGKVSPDYSFPRERTGGSPSPSHFPWRVGPLDPTMLTVATEPITDPGNGSLVGPHTSAAINVSAASPRRHRGGSCRICRRRRGAVADDPLVAPPSLLLPHKYVSRKRGTAVMLRSPAFFKLSHPSFAALFSSFYSLHDSQRSAGERPSCPRLRLVLRRRRGRGEVARKVVPVGTVVRQGGDPPTTPGRW